jgi:lipoyl(octanoyl) transferase
VPEALAVLQHAPTYTLGTGSSLENIKFDIENPPHPLYRTERGGEVTFHGPGQLTVYPILDLKRHGQDLHLYLRALEEVIMRALDRVSGIAAYRIEGLTGMRLNLPVLNMQGTRLMYRMLQAVACSAPSRLITSR